MTVRQISETMDSREFSEWKAFSRFFEPFGDEWRQSALIMCAALAPYCRRDKIPKPDDFMPVQLPPQSQAEIRAEMKKIYAMQGLQWQDPEEKPETPST